MGNPWRGHQSDELREPPGDPAFARRSNLNPANRHRCHQGRLAGHGPGRTDWRCRRSGSPEEWRARQTRLFDIHMIRAGVALDDVAMQLVDRDYLLLPTGCWRLAVTEAAARVGSGRHAGADPLGQDVRVTAGVEDEPPYRRGRRTGGSPRCPVGIEPYDEIWPVRAEALRVTWAAGWSSRETLTIGGSARRSSPDSVGRPGWRGTTVTVTCPAAACSAVSVRMGGDESITAGELGVAEMHDPHSRHMRRSSAASPLPAHASLNWSGIVARRSLDRLNIRVQLIAAREGWHRVRHRRPRRPR
jgi:hypothetical protein